MQPEFSNDENRPADEPLDHASESNTGSPPAQEQGSVTDHLSGWGGKTWDELRAEDEANRLEAANRPPSPPSSEAPNAVGPAGHPPRVQVPVKLPETPPTFTYILLGAIIAIYLIGQVIPLGQPTMAGGYWVTTTEEWLFANFYKDNTQIIEYGQYYRLLTAIFLHGSLMHLFFNGYALYVIGRGIERLYGHGRFLLIYFLGGLTGSVASLLLSPYPSLGASGAIFALFGAEAIFFYRHRELFGQMAQARLKNMGFLIVLNLAIGLSPGSNIDNWGHIGGFVGGLALAWFIGPMFKPVPPTPAQPYVALDDTNPLKARLVAPFLYACGLLLAVGLAVLLAG